MWVVFQADNNFKLPEIRDKKKYFRGLCWCVMTRTNKFQKIMTVHIFSALKREDTNKKSLYLHSFSNLNTSKYMHSQ